MTRRRTAMTAKHGDPLGALLPRPAAQADTPAAARTLTQEEAAILGDGLHELFCAQARALTMGESSSLPQETAAELMAKTGSENLEDAFVILAQGGMAQ